MSETPEQIERPEPNEYDPFYRGYIESAPDGDIVEVMEVQLECIEKLPAVVEPEKEQYRYAEGKWSVRELVGHLSDTERLFGYRAFCISRGDQSALPGYDENEYLSRSNYDDRSLKSLVEELIGLRESNLRLFRSLPPGSSTNSGNANGTPVSVRALAYILCGHAQHHFDILAQRYGISIGDR